jgi:hypothetical protein
MAAVPAAPAIMGTMSCQYLRSLKERRQRLTRHGNIRFPVVLLSQMGTRKIQRLIRLFNPNHLKIPTTMREKKE